MKSGGHRHRVLIAIAHRHPDGISRYELEKATGLNRQTVQPRVWECGPPDDKHDHLDLIKPHPTKVGTSPDGNPEELLILTEKGEEFFCVEENWYHPD